MTSPITSAPTEPGVQGNEPPMSNRDHSLPSQRRRWAKGLTHPLCAILLFSALTGIGHTLLLADWNPFLSADTHYYFAPSLEVLNRPEQGFRQLFVKPFFRAARDTIPMSEEAKPVFVCALRLWHLGWKHWVQPDLVLPDPRPYAAFVVVSCAVAFLSLCLLGWKVGHPWIGIATATAALWGPWGLATCYFSTYTAFSLALLSWAMILLFCRPRWTSLVAGVLVSFSLLSNQSLTACIPALPLFIFWHKRKEGRQHATRMATAFVLGMILPFAVCQLLGATNWVKVIFAGAPIQKPFDILELYLARVRSERLEFLPAYQRSFFLMLSCLNSRVLTAVGAGIVMLFVAAVIRWTLLGNVAGLRQKLSEPAIQDGLLILLPGLAFLLVIDGRTAIKVSRAYYLAVPFLVMGLLLLGHCLVQNLPRRLVRIGVACLVLAGGIESFLRVRDFHQAFQGSAHALQSLAKQSGRVVALQQDIYAPFFGYMAGVQTIDAGQPIPNGVSYIVTGPLVPGALEHTTGQMNLIGYLLGNQSRLTLVRDIPFFSLYPFVVYEDPEATFNLEVQHQFDRKAYRECLGSVKIWRVSPSDVPLPAS